MVERDELGSGESAEDRHLDDEAASLDPAGEEALFQRIRDGDVEAQNAVFTLVYEELHRFARRGLGRQGDHHTLGATGVVNEVFLRLVKAPRGFVDKQHFMAIAARCVRQVIIDYARYKRSGKRPPADRRIELDELLASYEEHRIDVLALDSALTELGARDPQLQRLVELRYFAGQTMEDCAAILGMSRSQATRKLQLAIARLSSVLGGNGEES